MIYKRFISLAGLILFFWCIGPVAGNSQDSLINYLVNRISEQQVKDDPFFLEGGFRAYISPKRNPLDLKKDNNIFFPALITFTIDKVKGGLNAHQIAKLERIREETRQLSLKFKNKKGRDTYNFWRTDSAFAFPFTNWISIVAKNVTLPDDMDDTALTILALEVADSTAKSVHKLMQGYTNTPEKRVRSARKEYRQMPAYSTWFGKKFPVNFDVCVMSNVLTFVQAYNLDWTKADSATLQLIVNVLKNKDHIRHGLDVAPFYEKPSIILYHIARLMSVKPIAELEAMKVDLVIEAVRELQKTHNIVEQMMLCSAIMKWGYIPPRLPLPPIEHIEKDIEQNTFAFAAGNMTSYFPNTFKKLLVGANWGIFYHHCPAFNNTLFLEYLLLKKECER